MAKSVFKPLTMELIDEGRFQKDVNAGLDKIMRDLIEYKKKHGKDVAIGAKATLNVKLTLCFDGRDDNDFSIKGETSTKVPGPPARLTIASENEEQDGTPTLFVRATGSTNDTPRQGIITTREGEIVDPETGEIKTK